MRTPTSRRALRCIATVTCAWVAEGVRRLNVTSVTATEDFVLLYERNRQFVIALVDGHTFKASREQVFDIPALK